MISIIIPVFNNHEMTKQCVESIKDNTKGYELIIIDNGSTPPVNLDCDLTIRNNKNTGFPVAVNHGILESTGEIICLLNNDTVVTPGWADKLKKRLGEYSIVSCMTNYAAGLQRVITTAYDDNAGLNYAANEWAEKHKGITQEVNFVIGFCMMFPRTIYDELGEFDESMWPCSGEEVDFCFRARKAGHRIGIAKDVYIHHYGSQTFNEMQNAGLVNYKDICKKCDAHLSDRWGEDFWHRQKWIPKETGVRLNLGCGAYKMEDFVNVDQLEKVNPDIVCNATELPYEDKTISEIYCGHMLEHMTLEAGKKALEYWGRLLIPGGKITITVPDFDVLATEYVDWPTTEKLKKLNDLYIYSYCQESHHKYCYSADLLKEVMKEAGFTDLKKLPVDHPYFVDPVSWQVAFTGRKI